MAGGNRTACGTELKAPAFLLRSADTAFRELDHAADIFLEIYGSDIAELYENGLYALYCMVTELPSVQLREERRFTVNADTVEEGLRQTLAEAVFLLDTEAFLGGSAQVDVAEWVREQPHSPSEIEARVTVWGEAFTPGRHEMLADVKAVTHHQLEARCDPADGWTATVILDV